MTKRVPSDLTNAQALIEEKNIPLTEISKRTGISLPRIKAYRADPEKLRTASWENVRKLSELAVNFYLQQEVGLKKALNFRNELPMWFDDIKSKYERDPEMQDFLSEVERLIERDPLLVARLADLFGE